MLGAGLWMHFNYPYEYGTLLPQYSYASSDIVVLTIGGLIFFVAFFGCCGAWFQSRCLLITVGKHYRSSIYYQYSTLSSIISDTEKQRQTV